MNMTIKTIFLLVMAAVVFIGVPIMLVFAMVDMMRTKSSERRGGGGMSSAVGGAMMEMDRFIRPSVEHQIEAQDERIESEDNDGD
jgi:hypothetical protein